jgi:hypothetical protein
MMRDQTTTDEIAQIERELEILRSRQASLARWYRITMIYLAITFPVIAAVAKYRASHHPCFVPSLPAPCCARKSWRQLWSDRPHAANSGAV